MDFTGILIPSIVILIANIFSDKHGSYRYECVTAIFGWTVVLSFALYIFVTLILLFHSFSWIQNCKQPLLTIFYFCIITALSRDYEKILKLLIDSFHKKK